MNLIEAGDWLIDNGHSMPELMSRVRLAKTGQVGKRGGPSRIPGIMAAASALREEGMSEEASWYGADIVFKVPTPDFED